jgi:C-terminal processing protease CtpA/Prc
VGLFAKGDNDPMTEYRIHRMKESVRQQFRWAPHTIGITSVKRKDYDLINAVHASGPYAVWMELKDTDEALRVGDILEVEGGELRIYKYVGFEEAQWVIPEVKSGVEAAPVAVGQPPTAP